MTARRRGFLTCSAGPKVLIPRAPPAIVVSTIGRTVSETCPADGSFGKPARASFQEAPARRPRPLPAAGRAAGRPGPANRLARPVRQRLPGRGGGRLRQGVVPD